MNPKCQQTLVKNLQFESFSPLVSRSVVYREISSKLSTRRIPLCIDRRQFVLGSISVSCSTALGSNQTAAQSYPLLCSWSGASHIGQGLAPASPSAIREVEDIAAAIDYRVPIQIFMGGVPNASATILSGYPTIVYNPNFLNQLASCHRVSAVAVLAHEVGHHANADTSFQAQFRHSWSKELGADWVSGLALGRLGVSLESSLSGIHCGIGAFSPGSPSHPDGQRRLRAVTEGWHAA